MEVNINEKQNINGTEQFIAIRAERKGLPLLLYLHGGPGDAALPLVLKYNMELANYFTLVIWEQRGAGKSYYKFSADETISIDTFVSDTYTLVQWLLTRFGQENLYLAGHSWGSILGLMFTRQYPHMVQAYIGCGQVVDMQISSKTAYEYAVKHASGSALTRLREIDSTYSGNNWLDDLLFVTGQVVKYGGSLYGKRNYSQFIWDTMRSKEYTISDLINRQRGAVQTIRRLWQEIMTVSFWNMTSFDAPIIFVEGKFDYHVSSKLVKEYFDTISTSKQFYLFDESCHFPQWSEPQRFTQVLAGLLK